MELKDINKTEYIYSSKNIDLSGRVRWHIFWSGLRDRKNTLKKFCLECGIEYPPKRSQHYVLPKSYMIESKEIEYLDKVRDNIIIANHNYFLKNSKNLIRIIKEVESRISNNEAYIESEEKIFDSIKENLKKEKDPSNLLGLQNNLSTQDAKLKNLVDDNSKWVNLRDELIKTKIDNHKSWLKQIDTICNAVDMYKDRYCNSATRKIQNILNYTTFSYQESSFNDELNKIIRGDGDEENN